MRRAANLAAILGFFIAAPLAVTAAVLVSVNAAGTCSGNGPARHPQTGSSGEFVVSEGDTHNDTNGVQGISVKPICTGFLVDRVTDAPPASPGSPVCAAVGGGCTLRAADVGEHVFWQEGAEGATVEIAATTPSTRLPQKP